MKFAAPLLLLCPLMTQAANYTATRALDDGIDIIRLSDSAARVEVSVVPSIGNIAYSMKVNGKNLFWTPFSKLSELKQRPALCGNPFLAPWANRLDRDEFFANGKQYSLSADLGNLRRDGNKLPIHGLLMFSPLWQVTEVSSNEDAAWVTSRLEFWRYPDLMAQFPFAHTLEMTYRLSSGSLEVRTRIENLATEAMPVGIGFHPYFRLHDSPRDQWRVHLAAREHLTLSPKLTPTGEATPIALADPLPLAGTQLDDVFSGLVRNGDGKAEFWVAGSKEKISVTYGPQFPVAVVYAPKGREFICFEPMSIVTNGFNLAQEGKWRGLQTVPPGGLWQASFWISGSGF